MKRSLVTGGYGIPLGLVVAGANVNDHCLLVATLDELVEPRPTAPADTHGLHLHLCTRGEELIAQMRKPGWRARRWVVEHTHS